MYQITKGLSRNDPFPHGDLPPLHLDAVDIPTRPRITTGRPLKQLKRCRGAPAERGIGGRIQGIAEKEPVGVGCCPRRAKRRLVQLIKMVQHLGSTSRLRIYDTAKCCIAESDGDSM